MRNSVCFRYILEFWHLVLLSTYSISFFGVLLYLLLPLFGYGEARKTSDNSGTGETMETVTTCGCAAGGAAGTLTPLWSLLPFIALFRRDMQPRLSLVIHLIDVFLCHDKV